MTFVDGQTYEGEWLDNVREGHGSHRYADGASYSGEWRDGSRSAGALMLPGLCSGHRGFA